MENYINILSDWSLLNKTLGTLSIDELKALINYEVSTKCRASFINRMHQRYSKKVTIAEREHLIKGGLL